MARTLYGATGGDIIAQLSSDGDYEPSTATFEVFTTRTGSTQHTDLTTVAGGAITTVTPDVNGRIQFFGQDGYSGEYWLRNQAAPAAARYAVFPADLASRSAGSVTDHVALPDPHAQYQKESEKGAAGGYPSLDGTTKVPIAQVPTGTTGSTVALGNAAAALLTGYYTTTAADARYVQLPATHNVGDAIRWNGTAWVALPVAGGDTQAPTQINNLVEVSSTQTTASISWDASTDDVGVVGYRVYKVTGNVGGGGGELVELIGSPSAATTSFSVSSLTAGTDYEFRVTAVDAVGNESIPTALFVTTPIPIDVTPPTVPTNLAAPIVGTTSVQLDWSASTDTESGVGGYKVYQGLASGTVDLTTPIATVTSLNYTVTGLTANTGYKWRVSAFDSAPSPNESVACPAITVTTLTAVDTTPPFQVTGLAASAIQATALTLSWTATTDNPTGPIATYNIYRALGAGSGSGGASPFLTHAHEGTVGTTPTGPAEGYGSRTGTAVAYTATAAVGSQSLRFDGTALTYFDDVAIGSGTLSPSMPIRVESIGASSRFLAARAGTTNVALVDIGATGKLRILNGTSGFLAESQVFTAAINTWYRIDAKFSNGSATVRIFDAPGTTLLDTVTTSATTAGVPDGLRVGLRAVGDPILIDQVKVATNWITVVPGAGTTTFLASVLGTRLTYAATGLQPATLYSFQVAAVDPTGLVGTKSTAVTPTTAASATKQIIYGINAATNDPPQRLGDRTAANGWQLSPTDTTSWVTPAGSGTGVGMTRVYYGSGLPSGGFTLNGTTGNFGTNAKKRCNVTFKGATPQQVLAGQLDVDFVNYVNTAPTDWTLAMTYWHEPADNLNTGDFTADKYRQAQIRFGALLENRTMGSIGQTASPAGLPAVNPAAGTDIYMAVCITLRGAASATTANMFASSKWDTGTPATSVMNAVPQATDMDVRAMILLDAYQNPPPSINPEVPSHRASPPPYTNAYPTPANVHGFFFAHVINEYEWNVGQHAWGVGEWMAPLRDDDTATGQYQAEAMEAYLTYCEAATPPPRVILLWESPSGNQYNQIALPAGRRVVVQHALGQYAI